MGDGMKSTRLFHTTSLYAFLTQKKYKCVGLHTSYFRRYTWFEHFSIRLVYSFRVIVFAEGVFSKAGKATWTSYKQLYTRQLSGNLGGIYKHSVQQFNFLCGGYGKLEVVHFQIKSFHFLKDLPFRTKQLLHSISDNKVAYTSVMLMATCNLP